MVVGNKLIQLKYLPWLLEQKNGYYCSCKEPTQIGRLFRVDPLVLNSSDQLLLILHTLITFYKKTTNLNEEVKCTEHSLPVSVPWWLHHLGAKANIELANISNKIMSKVLFCFYL